MDCYMKGPYRSCCIGLCKDAKNTTRAKKQEKTQFLGMTVNNSYQDKNDECIENMESESTNLLIQSEDNSS